jgi:hypothetical protein
MGKSLIPQPFYPLPLSTEKPSMDPGKTLATLGFTDIFYCPWTVFIFPGRDLFSVYKICHCKVLIYSTVTLLARLRGLSTSLPRWRAA